MKVLLIGFLNAYILAQQLRYYGVNATALSVPPLVPNPTIYKGFDTVYGVYLTLILRNILFIKLFRKKCLVHVVGSDAFKYAVLKGIRKKLQSLALTMCDEILYVTDELKQLVGLRTGKVIPIPIDTRMFRRKRHQGEKRDILYYCTNPRTYRLEWILKYAKEHPDESITVLGCPHYIDLPNVKVVPLVPYHQMPELYSMHRRLIRMTTHDGYPKMPYEALSCGLEVMWNGQKLTKVPAEMLMENTIPKLISILNEL